MRNTTRPWVQMGWSATALMGAALLFPSTALAYPRYNSGCQNCHGSFTGATSPRGTVFPLNSKHEMHRNSNYMATNCNLCHTNGDNNNPYLGSSNGTANNPGVGCAGCHGQNFGGTIGNRSAGLRAYHARHGVTSCANCHGNDPAPLPESSRPVYYGTPDTRAADPCNLGPNHLENWSVGDTLGLDNDGDGVLDAADSDCAQPCPGDLNGDRVVDLSDLAGLLANYGCTGSGCVADFDGNGAVDLGDLSLLLSKFGTQCG